MIVSLYTSRVILHTLGIVDFGIYNLVGGVVVLFTFLNGAMARSTQRYLNIEIASDQIGRVNKVFCMSLNIHILISLIVLILSETIGLWFVNYKLNIPADRIYATNWIFQMSIFTTIIDIMRIPYNGAILAYEKMSFFAYIGIFETIMKLVIVYMVAYVSKIDHLILYATLLMLVNFLVSLIYRFYCRYKFTLQTQFHFYKDKPLFKEMVSFSGWNIFGQTALLGANQGINMILNIFIGVTINAAIGIANQVNSAIYSFISNFQLAFNPQIIQTYAQNNLDRHKSLILSTSKLSFFLIALLGLPVISFTEFILRLWLGNNLPVYVVPFTQFIILNSMIDALIGPFWMSANAIGNIRNYQIIISIFIFLNVPLALVILYLNWSPVYVIASKLIVSTVTLGYRFYYAEKTLKFTKSNFTRYMNSLIGTFVFSVAMINVHEYINNDWLSIIASALMLELTLLIIIFLTGLSKTERSYIYQLIVKKLIKTK